MAAAPVNYCDTYRDFDPAQLTLLLYVQPAEKRPGVITYHKMSGQNWVPLESPDFRSNPTKKTLLNIINKINAHMCYRNGGRIVDEGYMESRFAKNQIYLILFDERNKAPQLEMSDGSARELMRTIGSPIAFIMSSINNLDDYGHPIAGGEIYIDIICSCSGAGRYLLHFMEQYAKEEHNNAISLSSLPNVLLYYPGFGFTHRHTCHPSADVDEIDPTHLPIWGKKKVYASKKIGELYDDDEFSEYMSMLQENLYGDQKKPGCIAQNLKRLSSSQKKKSIKDNDCGDNGYRMRKCLHHQTVRPPAAAQASKACNADNKKGYGYGCVVSGGKK